MDIIQLRTVIVTVDDLSQHQAVILLMIRTVILHVGCHEDVMFWIVVENVE